MYIGWYVSSASAVQVQNKQHNAHNSDLQHANFDVLKLPVLEVCFYTPRSGGVTSVLYANH